MILIGRIIGTHGLKGVLKIKPVTDFLVRFNKSEVLCVAIGDGPIERFRIESSFERKGSIFVKFENVDNLDQAVPLVEKDIVIDESDLKEFEPGSYYVHDLIGLKILDETENLIGEITNVLQLSSNDVYEAIDKTGKKLLIPAVKDFIGEVNLEFGFMKLKNTEGMFD